PSCPPRHCHAVTRLGSVVPTRLLRRNGQGPSLLPASEPFAADARRILEDHASALDRARRLDSGQERELRLGFVNSLAHWHLPRLLAHAAEQLPGLRLHLRQTSTAELTELVRSGAVD
ncbi:hypothetical protein VM98_35500, partial [Streptomyces rubellomurinus subsp. indigoferus]